MSLAHRVAGPLNGLYVSAVALRMGEFGDQFEGHYKVFPHPPHDHYAPGWLASGTCEEPVSSRTFALNQAIDSGLAAARAQPAGPGGLADADADGTLAFMSYVSTTTGRLTGAELERVLQRARERNAEYGITGMLVYSDEHFLQYIEGPAAHLELVYHFIRRDRAHTGFIELSRGVTRERVFSNWSMAFSTPETHLWRGPQDGLAENQPLEHAASVVSLIRGFTQALGVDRPDIVASAIAARSAH